MTLDASISIEAFEGFAEQIATRASLHRVWEKLNDDLAQHHAVGEFSGVLPGFAVGLVHPIIVQSAGAESIA